MERNEEEASISPFIGVLSLEYVVQLGQASCSRIPRRGDIQSSAGSMWMLALLRQLESLLSATIMDDRQ